MRILPDLEALVADALIAHLRNLADFAAAYPVPSVSMWEPAFCPEMQPGNLQARGRAGGNRLVSRCPTTALAPATR